MTSATFDGGRRTYYGNKLAHIASAAAFVKGAIDTGKAVWGAAQAVAPYAARIAPMLL